MSHSKPVEAVDHEKLQARGILFGGTSYRKSDQNANRSVSRVRMGGMSALEVEYVSGGVLVLCGSNQSTFTCSGWD